MPAIITGKVSDQRIRDFISFVSGRHPVSAAVTYVMKDAETVSHPKLGKKLNGFMQYLGPYEATIKLATAVVPGHSLRTILHTAAHEYCHVIQMCRDRIFPKKSWDASVELPAEEFATDEIRAALAAGVITL